jgi:uncharacterized protein YndB with AHSA1/START domain
MAAPGRVRRRDSGPPLATQRGVFVIADISGYTGYVVHSPLEQAEDVVADVTVTVSKHLSHVLRVNKLEGDAIFAYAPERGADASAILDAVEQCYFAFRSRLEGIERSTSCTCAACRKAAELNLKFVLHAGEYVSRRGAHGEELTGRDVIVAHRLLKNGVAEACGLNGYAMVTEGFAGAFGLDTAALGMRPHVESYSDVGELRVFVSDLERRYAEERDRRRVVVDEQDAAFALEQAVPAPPSVAWEFLTAPDRRLLWQGTKIEEVQAGGRRSTGTWSVCVDGRTRIYEEILDWRPFTYFTESRTSGRARYVLTTSLEPNGDGGTLVRVRGRGSGRLGALSRVRLVRRLRAELRRLGTVLQSADDQEGRGDAGRRVVAGQHQGA